MYTGRMIEQLIRTVEDAEQDARKQKQTIVMSPRVELQAFFCKMQMSSTQMRAGIA